MSTLSQLINLIPTAPWMAKVTTPDEVRKIISFNHVHIAQEPGFPEYWRTATVISPADNSVHKIQLVYEEHKKTCNCYCGTCQKVCPQAIAAFLVNWEDYVLPKLRAAQTCPACGEPLASHEQRIHNLAKAA